ncbi:MAG: DUF3604 domain-containing protein [bacterium]
MDSINLNPGGLAVVWAEENSRDSIFSAMRRKETYGTSGTRPIVRFFGGWNFGIPDDRLCSLPNRVAVGYAQGVPMGSDLPSPRRGDAPRFLVSALKDAGSEALPGTPLQRIQIIKGWVDAAGQTHEEVADVIGNTTSAGNELNTDTCEPNLSAGFNELCAVWEDKNFDPARPPFITPGFSKTLTCRWSTFACKAAGVDPYLGESDCHAKAAAANAQALARGEIQSGETPFDNCCINETNSPFISRTIQERAWTSPIWFVPSE